MSVFLRKYATATHIYIPIVKRGVVDFAVGADWTPATGDCKVSIDGGAVANIGTLPTAIAAGNTAFWDFTIATGEVTGKKITITVADAATKVVEDQAFLIETYGHASAEYQADLSAANLPAQLGNVAHGGVAATITAERIIVASTTSNEPAMKLTGNGSGAGLLTTGGTTGDGIATVGTGSGDGLRATGGTTGRGLHGIGGATSGAGLRVESSAGNSPGLHALGNGSGAGLETDGGATGDGAKLVGGATSGHSLNATTTSGDGLHLAPTAGHGISAAANGTSKHGLQVTGGTAGTSDGLNAVAGTGGVPIRGDLTGNITGTLSTVTTLTNAPSDSSGTTTLLSRLTATRAGYLDNLSAGAAALEASVQSVLSKLLKYVQLMVRKDAAIATDNATEVTAINANGGSGAGAYANTTDALEALRDRGDAAWTTATGFSTLTQADIRTATGLASANLDTQLSGIQSDTDNIQTRLPAALVSGRMDASVGAMATDTVTAAALAADAVTEIQTGLSTLTQADIRTATGLASANLDTQLAAIQSDTDNLQTRLPAALVGGRMDSNASAIEGTVLSGKVGDNLNVFFQNAGNDTTVIVDDVSTGGGGLTQADVRTAVGLASANLDAQLSGIQSDTDNIQTRLPAALVGGRMDSNMQASGTGAITAATFAAGAIDAAAIATDAIGSAELAASAITEIQSGLSTLDATAVRAAVGLASANLDTQLDALPTNAELATALGTADDATLLAIAALNNISTAQVNAQVAAALATYTVPTQAGLVSEINSVQGDIAALTLVVTNALSSGIKRNTTHPGFVFHMVLASDHLSPATGLAVTAERRLDDGAYGPCASTVTELSDGDYTIDLDATDTNATLSITLRFSAALADTLELTFLLSD